MILNTTIKDLKLALLDEIDEEVWGVRLVFNTGRQEFFLYFNLTEKIIVAIRSSYQIQKIITPSLHTHLDLIYKCRNAHVHVVLI